MGVGFSDMNADRRGAGLPEREGARPLVVSGNGRKARDEPIRLTCEACGRMPLRVLQRLGGPQDFHHHPRGGRGNRGASCRVIAIPDPYGDGHVQETVPTDMSIEDYLEVRMAQWRREFPFVRAG